MHDVSQIDITHFAEFLLKSHIVVAGKKIFLVHWVKRFFKIRQDLPGFPWHEQLPMYLDYLEESGNVQAAWQIRQAEQAVRVYFTNYLGSLNPDAPERSLAQDSELPVRLNTPQAIDSYRELLRLKRYARSTEKSYITWGKRFFHYCHKQHPNIHSTADLTPQQVKDFLAHLAMNKNVSASKQSMAFNALLNFYTLVLHIDLSDMKEGGRARTSHKLPVVFSIDEARHLFSHPKGTNGLIF